MNMSKEDTLALIDIIDYYIKIYQEALNWYSQLGKWYHRFIMWILFGGKGKDGIYLNLLYKANLHVGICNNLSNNPTGRDMINNTIGWYNWDVFIAEFIGDKNNRTGFLHEDYPDKAYRNKRSVVKPINDRIERLKYMREVYMSRIS